MSPSIFTTKLTKQERGYNFSSYGSLTLVDEKYDSNKAYVLVKTNFFEKI